MKIEVVEYEPKYQQDLIDISMEWLLRYDLLEDQDMVMLNDPVGQVVEKGGHVYFALDGDIVAGTIALEVLENGDGEIGGCYEILKYGVRESCQGRGVGKALLEKVIEVSKAEGKKEVILCSNHKLESALSLYKRYGFELVPYEKSKFDLSDIRMILKL